MKWETLRLKENIMDVKDERRLRLGSSLRRKK